MGRETQERRRAQAQALYHHASLFVSDFITQSREVYAISEEYVKVAVGFYLLWKGALQQNAAQQAHKAGEREWAKKLQKSATMHAVLALQTLPEVVEYAGQSLKQNDLRDDFQRARFFGEVLAKTELEVRGRAGFTRPLSEIERIKLGKMLQKPPLGNRRQQVVTAA